MSAVEKEEVVCERCSTINDFHTEVSGPHIKAICNNCNEYIKFMPQGSAGKFHFGKHAGVLVEDCQDLPYMEFMLEKVDRRFRIKLEDQIQKIKQKIQETPGEINNQKQQTNTMDITGVLRVKNEAEQVSDKFRKREFVLTDNSSQYPQHISFQLTQDKCNLIDTPAVGATIKVHFNLRGREWTSPKGEVKYFNTLEAWRIEVLENLQVDTGATAQSATENGAAAGDDLPF